MRGQRILSVVGCGVLVSVAWGMAMPVDGPPAGADASPDAAASNPVATLTDNVLIYRGDLSWRGTPWSGLADLEFRLFASSTGVDQIGSPVTAAQWPVTEGMVVVGLDFGVTDPALVSEGAWMEVSVNGTILSPRRFIPAAGWALSPGQVGSTGLRHAIKVDRELLDELESEERQSDEAGDGGDDSDETGGSLGGGAGSGGNGGGGAGAPSRPNHPGLPGGGFGGGSGGLGGGGWGNEGEMGEPDGGGWQLGTGFVWTTDRVGIGTSNPNSGTQLHVVSNKFKTLWARNTNPARHAIFSNSGLIFFEGNVGLGTQTPADRLHLVEGTGRFENSSTSGVAVVGEALASTGITYGLWGHSASASGRAVFGVATSTTGGSYGGSFSSLSNAGVGVQGHAGASTGSTIGVNGKVVSTSGTGVFGEALASTGFTTGVFGMSNSTQGRGAYGFATSFTGNTIGVLGQVASPTGFAGYFAGPAGSRNYFERSVGIGTEIPLAELHVANVSGNADLLIKRNDSTFGFNLGVSGTPTKLFMARTDGTTFTDIMTLDGSTDRVGIGTTSPDSRLDVRGFAGEDALRVRVDGATKFRVYSNGGVAIGSNPTAAPQDGLYVQGSVGIGVVEPQYPMHVETIGARAIHGESSAVGGVGIMGRSTATAGTGSGVYGWVNSSSGVGVYGWASSPTGQAWGVRGVTESNEGTGVSGFAPALTGSTLGVRGTSDSTTGTGVLGHARAVGGQNFGVRAHTESPEGYAGYFTGPAGSRNYFAQSVGIGVLNPTFQLHLSTNSAAKPTSNTWTISSDARLKKNIRTINHALDDLLALRGVTYQWIDPASQGDMAGTYTGFIAQEVEPIFPEWISEDAEGFKRLTVIGFEGIVVEALRELRAEKDAQIAERDAEIADLRARLDRLEKHLLRAGSSEE